MKKILALFFLIGAGMSATAFIADNSTTLNIGAALPKGDIKMKDAVTGKDISMSESKMKNGLLVVFSCNTCPVVIKHESAILESAKLAKESNIGCILVNSNEAKRAGDDSQDAMKAYAKKQGYTFSYVADINSAVADAFGATRTPEVFLFDKDLKLVYKGAYTDDSDPKLAKTFYLNDAIKSVRDGKPVSLNTTKSIGCTIKRVTPVTN